MTTKRILGRILCAAGVGFASVAACAGAAPAGDPSRAWTPDPSESGDEAAKRDKAPDKAPDRAPDKAPPDAGPDGGPRCPYGELNDPHRGFVRCLLPDERDAGWLPPPPQGPQGDAPPAEPPKAEPPKAAGAPPAVEIGAPKFENGEVTKVEKSLGKHAAEIGKCVAEHGGLTGEAGSLKVQFLVRARGRAEGVEVLAAKGISAEASACVRQVLKNKAIGAPTSDPVGVTVIITLKAAK